MRGGVWVASAALVAGSLCGALAASAWSPAGSQPVLGAHSARRPTQDELVAAQRRQARAVRAGDVDAANRDMDALAARYPSCRFHVRFGVAPSPRSAGIGIDGAMEAVHTDDFAHPMFSTRTVKDGGRWLWFLLVVDCEGTG